jgi:hypothetical protein
MPMRDVSAQADTWPKAQSAGLQSGNRAGLMNFEQIVPTSQASFVTWLADTKSI